MWALRRIVCWVYDDCLLLGYGCCVLLSLGCDGFGLFGWAVSVFMSICCLLVAGWFVLLVFAAGMVGWVGDLLFDRFFGLLFVGL